MHDADYWIAKLDLQEHPEGGYFRETYRAAESIPRNALPARFDGDRAFSTCIYFLLKGKQFSAFHRIRQDEIWHFYAGTALTIHTIDPRGNYQALKLGKDPEQNESLQVVVKAGDWFAASVDDSNSYTLAGCTVAPGFDFADFEMPSADFLIERFPQHKEIIGLLAKLSSVPNL